MRKIFTFLCAALMSVGMFAQETTVVFAANNKTVERTVTLPHTFKCSWDNGMDGPDELDIIIHELYNDYYYCNSNMNASGSDQVEVGTEENPKNDYITIKGVFEGTATVTGDYFDWITGEEGAHNYSITISIKGDEPELELDKTVGYVAFPTENRPASIELAGVNRDFTWPMAVINDPWYITDYNFDNYLYTAVSDTIKFRDAANNAIVLCEFIPANGGQEGRWQQYYLKMADYEMALEKGVMVRLIDELDLSNASNYAWVENAPEPLPEGIENIVLTEKAQKVIVDGMVYIVRDGKLFNLTGAQVR